MDLSYPIFKLETRAEWERECAERGSWSSGSSGGETVECTPEENARLRAGCLERAASCEEAARLLRQHSKPSP